MGWKRVAVPDLETAKPLEVRLKGRVGQAEGSELSHVTSERPPERPGLDATNPQAGARGVRRVVLTTGTRPIVAGQVRSAVGRAGGGQLGEPGVDLVLAVLDLGDPVGDAVGARRVPRSLGLGLGGLGLGQSGREPGFHLLDMGLDLREERAHGRRRRDRRSRVAGRARRRTGHPGESQRQRAGHCSPCDDLTKHGLSPSTGVRPFGAPAAV